MNRRDLLIGAGIGASASFAGCSGRIRQVVNSLGGEDRMVGEPATYEGVEVTPDSYILTEKVTRTNPNNQNTVSAQSGAVFILTHLKVTHKGDSAQKFPAARGQDQIDLYYEGERVSESIRDDFADAYRVSGKKLLAYHTARFEADATGEVYPGKEIDGWLLHEIAENFTPGKLQLRIVWNPQMLGDEGETLHQWDYTSDAEVSTEEVEGDGDNTIEM